jgi:hypothetical protein
MKIKKLSMLLTGMLIAAHAHALDTNSDSPTIVRTKIHGKLPASTAHIVRFYIDEAPSNSGYETGNLHIIYSDKTEVIEKVPPKKESTENGLVENQEGISEPKLADDKRSIGWTEDFHNCATSYAVPLAIAVYQSGENVLHIQQGQMVWFWRFLDGGKKIAAVWGPTHGREVGDYQLYDVSSGRMLSEVFGNEKSQSLDPDAPEWAKQTEQEMNHQ